VLAALAAGVCMVSAPPAQGARWVVTDPGQGPVSLPRSHTGARELSGLAWAGGDRYYAVSDKLQAVFPLTIELQRPRGTIGAVAVQARIRLRGTSDLEGVVYDDGSVWVSDETGPAIREYRLSDGAPLRALELPDVFRHIRNNLSLESLSMDPERAALWTANEEALTVDGPVSSEDAGTVVRLQRFDRAGTPNGQWAYRTDPLDGNLLLPGRDIEASGVSDLVALPGGDLLVLERAYGAEGLRIRLYDVDFTGATDVGALSALAGAAYTPVRKTLLWQRTFPDLNYEGAALGPRLDDGAHSLVLISDDGQRMRQALYALTVRRAE
jgi:hypothetical protein